LKVWCTFRSDKKTIQKIIKHCPFDRDLLSPYWEKYASNYILMGWIYNLKGEVSWRVYPGEIPSTCLMGESQNHVIQKLGLHSGIMSSTWPASQSAIYWGDIKDTQGFLKELAPLLSSDRAIDLVHEFQKNGLTLCNVCTTLPLTKNDKIIKANFYFK